MNIFTYIDLELNQPSNSIIQLGYCVGDIKSKKVLVSDCLNVKVEEEINPFITNLTGITQQQVNNGMLLNDAYSILKSVHHSYASFINPVTWGGGDSELLKQQLKLTTEDVQWCFGRRWIDVKTLFVNWRISQNQPIQGGLARSMLKLGLKFTGQKHNAMDDAINTFYMHCAMLEKFRS